MEISFGQLFYGIGPHGYAILAVSPGASEIKEVVKDFCGICGSPNLDRVGVGYFLASKVHGGNVIMVRACDGPVDSMGRRTLLFHCLTAKKEDLEKLSIDAFSLNEKGVFASAAPGHPVSDITMDMQREESSVPPPPYAVKFPAVLRLPARNADLVRSLIRGNANASTWTTCADVADPIFDFCVVDMYAALPYDRFVYGEKGLLRMPVGKADEDENPEKPDRINPERMTSGALKVFVLINLVFSVACIALCIRGCNDDGSSSASLDEQIAMRYEKDVESLRTELEKTKNRLSGFENAMAEFFRDGGVPAWEECCAASRFLPRMEAQKTEKVFPAEYDIFKKIRSCVELANKLKMLDEEGGRK